MCKSKAGSKLVVTTWLNYIGSTERSLTIVFNFGPLSLRERTSFPILGGFSLSSFYFLPVYQFYNTLPLFYTMFFSKTTSRRLDHRHAQLLCRTCALLSLDDRGPTVSTAWIFSWSLFLSSANMAASIPRRWHLERSIPTINLVPMKIMAGLSQSEVVRFTCAINRFQ